jgi:hypothetical protein
MLGATVLVLVKQACWLVCLELRDDLCYFQSAQGSKTCRVPQVVSRGSA